jgi:hypothetical protein
MARARHLAAARGRVQKPISNVVKDSISVPILDVTTPDSDDRTRRSVVGYRIAG